MFHAPDQYRVTTGPMGTTASNGNDGLFAIPAWWDPKGRAPVLKVMASDGMGWEHVSVSLPNRCPTWEEMDRVKRLFWDDTDTVMQLHVPRAQHVNVCEYCLHLWRPLDGHCIPLPPAYMVG